MSADKEWRVGDLAVCPPHGVAQVVAIETHDASSEAETFYSFYAHGPRMRISIPARKLGEVGLRQIIGPHEAARVIKVLQKRARRMTGPWPQISRTLYKKLTSGSIYDAAEVVRDLATWKRRKPLSATVQHMLDVARQLVVAELAAATGRAAHEVTAEIDAALGDVSTRRRVR